LASGCYGLKEQLAAARARWQATGVVDYRLRYDLRADEKAEIVVLTYYNPLLAAWRQGATGQQAASQSKALVARLNASIVAAAGAVGAKVADVAGAFATADGSGSPQPVNVARICAWTWMCSQGDIHANDAGYAAMAHVFDLALGLEGSA
jgi:hypothetical protein